MEKVFFEEVNNKKIFCILSEVASPHKRIVIMSHGFRGSSIGPARQFVDFQKLLNQHGFSTLRFDQPHSGNSEGDFIDSSFKEWVETIVYFADKYIDEGYEVSLLGQSMGASATVIATNDEKIKDKIPHILLWVPDAKADIQIESSEIYEEGGQKYKGRFWQEAKDANFFACLEQYSGEIHLVYGQTDRYVRQNLMDRTIQIVKGKGQQVMVLPGQDHSPWEFADAQKVYREEIALLEK